MFAKNSRAFALVAIILGLASAAGVAYWMNSRREPSTATIAFIPKAPGTMLWEAERSGATAAAEALKCHLYWNAPNSETDSAGQITLIDKIVGGNYQGLVVAPDHVFALLSPLRRALAAGLPVVIVSAPVDLPPSAKLGYIVNDDEKMGAIAAEEVARQIGGEGSVALVGLTRHAPGVALRVRSAEQLFATKFPKIRIVSRVSGAYDSSRAQELAEGAVYANPDLKAILSFTATSTRGVYAGLKSRSLQQTIRLVGCEQDSDLLGYVETGDIAAILAEDTYRMGFEAVELIAASWAGKSIATKSLVPPLLITRHNLHSNEARLLTRLSR